jgi:hypothetical protein
MLFSRLRNGRKRRTPAAGPVRGPPPRKRQPLDALTARG